MTQEINKATNDHDMRLRIERSWQLQDLVKLPDVVSASIFLLGNLTGIDVIDADR